VKYLVVLALFAFVLLIIYLRLRPYIRGVRRFIGVVREVNRMSARANSMRDAADLPREKTKATAAHERLVRCASCGTWMPASRAVTLRASGATYCSHACLERAADTPRTARKSAS
jgi:hypothetical protein